MELSPKKFENLPKFYKSNIKKKDDILYKKCILIPSVIKHLTYLKNIQNQENLVLPKELLSFQEKAYGYIMDYIKDSFNITEYLEKQPFETDIINLMNELFNILNKAHKYIVIGDIRNSNILLTKDMIYFCDLDLSYEKDKIEKTNWVAFYEIKIKDLYPFYQISPLSDTFKTFICALSLYYKTNIEVLKTNHNIMIEDVLEILTNIHANKYLLDYLTSLINDAKQLKTEATLDFTQISPFITPPSKDELEKIRTLIK